MLEKTYTFTDYKGNERTETYNFNLTEAELTMLQMSHAGGMKDYLEKITKAQDAPEIMAQFREIIRLAYGEISDDGRRFIKSRELTEAFEQTEAYSMLFMELCRDANAAAAFMNGIMPPAAMNAAASATPNVIPMHV